MLYGLNVGLNPVPRSDSSRGRAPSGEVRPSASGHGDHTHEHPAASPIDLAAMEAALASPAALAAGRTTFEKTCASCHEKDGGGSIGPNLTDDYWVHGNTHGRMLAIVSYGVLDKGMPGWSAVLKPEEIAQVTAYAAKLHGTTPANAKAPQGENLGAPVAEGKAAADSAR
jgi:mono/diheme cytochrome c family protein